MANLNDHGTGAYHCRCEELRATFSDPDLLCAGCRVGVDRELYKAANMAPLGDGYVRRDLQAAGVPLEHVSSGLESWAPRWSVTLWEVLLPVDSAWTVSIIEAAVDCPTFRDGALSTVALLRDKGLPGHEVAEKLVAFANGWGIQPSER